MAMIEFEDHSEENQKALLAYLDSEKYFAATPNRNRLSSIILRLVRLLRRWCAQLP